MFTVSELKSLGQEVTERTCRRLLKLEKENQRLLKVLEELEGTRLASDDLLSYISQECPTYQSPQRTPENDVNKQEHHDQSIHMTECFTEKMKETAKSECVVENGRMEQGDCKSPESSPAFTNGQMTVMASDTEHQHEPLENGNCHESELIEVENHQSPGRFKHHGQENRRLRQQEKIKEASLESCSLLSVLQKANCFSEVCVKIKDLENENQELLQQASTDKRLLTTMREVRLLRFGAFFSVYMACSVHICVSPGTAGSKIKNSTEGDRS